MTEAVQSQPRHRAFAALRQPGYGAYLGGTMLAMMADSIEHVISYWMIYEKFHSPALGGYAVISHWLPFLLFSVWSGALADRFDPRRIIQFGMVLFMLCSLGWGVLFITDTLQIWHAVVLLTIHGMAGVFWAPASQLLIHDIAGREQSAQRGAADGDGAHARAARRAGGRRRDAARLRPVARHAAQRADLCAADLVAVEGAVRPGLRARSRGRRARAEGGFAGVLATAREIAGNRIVVSMTLLAAASSFVIGNAYQAQMPEFAADLGHDHADFHYSMLLAANAAGALAAGLILETYGLLQARPKAAFVLVILWCVCIGGFAVSDNLSRCRWRCCSPPASSISPSARWRRRWCSCTRRTHIRGRVLGLYNMCFHGMRAFSGVTVGMGGSLVGVHWSLALSAVAMLVIAFGLLAFELRPRAPEPAE